MHLFLLRKGYPYSLRIPKPLLIMKFTALVILLTSLHISAESLGQRVTIDLKDARVGQLIKEIQKQTGYAFLYSHADLTDIGKITLHEESKDFREVLDKCFSRYPMTYFVEEDDKVVILQRLKEQPTAAKIPESRVVRQLPIQGMVTDTTGAPLIGVSVVLKNQESIGTTTDLNGRYVLDVPEKGVLVFSMIGFETQEIPIGGKAEIDVVLKVSASQLDDVVVVGFGKQKRTDLIGSVVSVKPSDLKVPSSNLTTALAGRIAGMIAYQRSGEPGQDNADFFIRGVTTFGYKVDPLILIDNVEVSTTDLARLQVDD